MADEDPDDVRKAAEDGRQRIRFETETLKQKDWFYQGQLDIFRRFDVRARQKKPTPSSGSESSKRPDTTGPTARPGSLKAEFEKYILKRRGQSFPLAEVIAALRDFEPKEATLRVYLSEFRQKLGIAVRKDVIRVPADDQ